MYAAKYGDQSLLVTEFSDDGDGRDWVVQSPSSGDLHWLQDRGLRQRSTQCTIVFCDEPGVGAYLDRFLAFRELARSSTPRLFIHPIHGAYEAAVTELSYSVQDRERCVRVSCTFAALEEPAPVMSIGSGVIPAAGPELVEARAAEVDSSLEDIGQSTDVTSRAMDMVQAWQELDVPEARTIATEAAGLAARIDQAMADLELATDLDRWAAYKSFVLLRDSITQAAESVASETERITSLAVEVAEPLITICARVYGAREAEDRARQVLRLNGIRTPGLVPAGTTLKMPVGS